jgi:hypothetical protein
VLQSSDLTTNLQYGKVASIAPNGMANGAAAAGDGGSRAALSSAAETIGRPAPLKPPLGGGDSFVPSIPHGAHGAIDSFPRSGRNPNGPPPGDWFPASRRSFPSNFPASKPQPSATEAAPAEAGRTLEDRIVPLAELERRAIVSAVREAAGDKLLAARLLGIGKTTLYRKLKEYGVT